MKQPESSILPILQSWREMCFVLFMNPFVLSFLLLFFFAFISHYSSPSQSFFSLCIFIFLSYIGLPAIFIYSRKLHGFMEHSLGLQSKNDWFSELSQVFTEVSNSHLMNYLRKAFHWVSRIFLQTPQFVLLFLILVCESITDRSAFSFLFLLLNCLLLFHSNHIQSLYLTLLLHHHSPSPSFQRGIMSTSLFLSHSLLAGLSYYSIRKLLQVLCALGILYFILYGSYYILRSPIPFVSFIAYIKYWNWLQSFGTVLILTNWFNQLSLSWIEYQIFCTIVDFSLSFSQYFFSSFSHSSHTTQFFTVHHSVSYLLALPVFLIYKSIQSFLHEQSALQYDASLIEESLPAKGICKPSFTMYHGLPILEGKEQRKLDELKQEERKCVWKSKRRKNASLIRKLHFDGLSCLDGLALELSPTGKIKKEKEVEKTEWQVEIPSVEPYSFMADECCMSELSPYVSIQPLQEDTTDKKLI